jgi:hypothetical protein
MPANVIATCFALIGFAAAVVVGFAAGNQSMTILVRALGAFFACLVVGLIVGNIAQRAVEQNIEAYKLANPIPSDPLKVALEATPAESNVDVIEESEPEIKRETKPGSKPATSRSAA